MNMPPTAPTAVTLSRPGRARLTWALLRILPVLLAAALCQADNAGPVFDLNAAARGPAAIVFGGNLESSARALAAACRSAGVADIPLVSSQEVMQPGTWRIGDAWVGRPLILLGDIVNNEALFALYSQYLEGVNTAYPDPGRYVLRTLFQPFRRGAPMLVIGGSDTAGVEAGVARCRAPSCFSRT